MISVVVTVAPRLTTVSVDPCVIVATDMDPGRVVTNVVPACVMVVGCGGSVTAEVKTIVGAGIETVIAAAGRVDVTTDGKC